ncbi:MAG: flagellar basal body-associated FliL family protein [bacterium]|nr:flagellar basal body-associated FliL family protein [bacterium]
MADKTADKKLPKTEQPETPAQPEAKKKSPLMKILVIAGILIAQTAAAYFIQKTLFFSAPSTGTEVHADGDSDAEAHGDEGEEEDEGGGHGKEAGGSSVAMLDEIIVNPAGTGGRRFLSTIVGFSLKDPKMEAGISEKMPLIRDAAISLLSSKSLDQLASLAYRDTLRSELQASVNGIMAKQVVKGVVFSTYVLQ